MSKQLNRVLGTCACLLLLVGSLVSAYDYPFANPYIATIVNTPAEYAAPLPAKIPVKIDSIKMFPDREVPGILWNLDELRYSYIRQTKPSPLIFLVAGTGASFNSAKMQIMQRSFYQAGYHVISLSSPTHPNFIVAASTSGVPGHLEEDSADLYQVMQAIWQKQQKQMEVTDFYLSGYSLGAAQSAFIAKLDEQEQAFNFRKVLLINPPVSLYISATARISCCRSLARPTCETPPVWSQMQCPSLRQVHRPGWMTTPRPWFLTALPQSTSVTGNHSVTTGLDRPSNTT